ncbi:MAG: aspartate carbamoyltransferase, partial [Nitrosospira sp.]
VFSKTAEGGLQQVVVKDRSDTEQIRLIQAHLSEISSDFKRGDFSKPERIHGKSMPGLAKLKAAKPGQIKIEYGKLPDGAQISYSTESLELINAIHQGFDAQLSDHARHAVPGHLHQHMHHK